MIENRGAPRQLDKRQKTDEQRTVHNAYHKAYQLGRYHARREEAKALLGGVCAVCGGSEDLEFDHIDPELKEFEIAKLWTYARTKFLAELEKCQLLCLEHHIKKTIKENSVWMAEERECCGKLFKNHRAFMGHCRWKHN